MMSEFNVVTDTWAHRDITMRCRTCMWFVPKAADKNYEGRIGGRLGRCRRCAPTHNGFPAVYEADWCGDHKLDEKRV
jgi:hypothetical protein